MSNTELTNTPDLSTLGQEAIKALVSGEKALAKATSLFTYIIAHAWNDHLFEAVIYKARTEEIERTDSFDLSDIINETNVLKSDGKRDNKLTKARLDAVASKLFDVDAFNVSQTNTFKDCLKVVGRLWELDCAVDEVQLSKQNNLQVPYRIAALKPKAEDTDALAIYEKRCENEEFYLIDGGRVGISFAELKRRIAPASERSATNDNKGADKAKSFRASIKFVADITKQFNSEATESDVALNADDEKAMFDLYIKLGKYFEANKLDAKDIKKLQEAA